MSLMLQGASLNEDEDWNIFFESLQVEKWKLDTEKSLTVNGLDMNMLEVSRNSEGDILYTFNDLFRRSFFWYKGSETTPPCTGDIKRYLIWMKKICAVSSNHNA